MSASKHNKGGNNMKKTIALSLITIMAITALFAVFSQATGNPPEASVIVLAVGNNMALVADETRTIDENFLVAPVIYDNRTFTPIRFVAESLGMTVDYNDASKTVSLSGNDKSVVFVIGSSEITINGVTKAIDAASFISNNRTLLPVRAVSEAIGKNVYYDDGLIVITEGAEPSSSKFAELRGKLGTLPMVGSQENLKKLLDETGYNNYRNMAGGGSGGFGAMDMVVTESAAEAPAPQASPENSKNMAGLEADYGDEYSKTNLQVEGVDEADVIKTDGNYIYKITRDGIVILSTNPLATVSTIDFDNNPIELYVDGDKLTAIVYGYQNIVPVAKGGISIDAEYYNDFSYQYTPPVTMCTVYDITDRSNPKLDRSFEVEGTYLTSRRIGDIVYIVTNQYVYCDDNDYYPMPICKDSATGNERREIPIGTVCYLPNFSDASYTVITSIDTANSKKAAQTETYLGAGSNAYVSQDNLYLSSTKYDKNYQESTQIYKFGLNSGNINYRARAAVPGNILNQFSMDEYNGNFRVATTEYIYDNWENDTRNNLYIFDEDMQPRGSIEGLAPGERIYSARFVGDRGYMVTFKQVDPLFVIDLGNIDNPTVLGYLKIPGYSDYLHPIDDDHIIGFGRDTTEEGDFALMQGFKMALFDVSDVHNPKQKFVEIIGGRGTYSELLYNHKALLYSAEKNLLAFPISVTEKTRDEWSYGRTVFEGAYVYKFSVDTGFDLVAELDGVGIQRILYAGDRLFTSAYDNVKAYTLDTFELLKTVKHD